jgi:hypothetical protein
MLWFQRGSVAEVALTLESHHETGEQAFDDPEECPYTEIKTNL